MNMVLVVEIATVVIAILAWVFLVKPNMNRNKAKRDKIRKDLAEIRRQKEEESQP